MIHPLITVVTVCYNAIDALRKTMKSVNDQSYSNIEYIIIDGGSNDSTVEMLERYDGKLTKWVSEKDKGIYDAMNKGVRLATGEWIIFMNAGDTFYNSDTIADIFATPTDPTTMVIYGDVAKADKSGNLIVKSAEEPHNSHRMFFCHQSAFARREALLKHPFDIKHKLSADFKFFKTLIINGEKFEHRNLPVSIFDTTGISNSSRSKGLKDNIDVVLETDNLTDKIRLLPRLLFTYAMCRLRSK